MSRPAARERLVDVPGGRVWTATYGDADATPLLVLHGGPGMPSYYLEVLWELADERRVVLFDQLGCGRSDRPDDSSLWTVARAVAEVEAVRRQLGLGRVHLLGHSWGGFLALAYATEHADAPASLTLSSPLVSVAAWTEEAAALVARLPEPTRRTIERHEADGTFDHPAYVEATQDFYRRFFCKLQPWPAELDRTFQEMGQEPYEAMWGPSEFTQTGNLRGSDLTPSLPGLQAPSLWICGTDDEVSPALLSRFAGLAGGQAHVVAGGSHCLHLEHPRAYVELVRGFLRDSDRAQSASRRSPGA